MSKNVAIAIGINDYYNLPPLSFAQGDAEAIREFLSDEIGFEDIYLLSDISPEISTPRGPMRSQPTFANLDRFFSERFEHPFLEQGDNLWFFFAGHGERHDGHDYLMPMDVNPRNVTGTAIKVNDLTDQLRNSGADNIVMLLDACRKREDRGSEFGKEIPQGVVTFYSCSPRESAYEIPELEHGAFTYSLLQGLRTQGAGNCATVERLDQYLRSQVSELSKQYHRRPQTPSTAVDPICKQHLLLLPALASLQDVQALKLDAHEAENEQQFDLADQLWTQVLAASPADQQAIKAIRRITIYRSSVPPSPVTPTPSAKVTARQPAEAAESKPEPAELTLPTFSFDFIQVDGSGREIERHTGQSEYLQDDLGGEIALEMVSITGGSFKMGSPKDEPKRRDYEDSQHDVTVPSFFMGRYPITQAQWRFVANLPQINKTLKADPSKFKGDSRPVERVSWFEAVEFCARLTEKTGRAYRLPSEAEWEYACRAGTKTSLNCGETITPEIANYDGRERYGRGPKGEYRKETTPVDYFSFGNVWGLSDMHGNVWEWCEDYWHNSYEGAPSDGSAWLSDNAGERRVTRGGSWGDVPWSCRSATRFNGGPYDASILLGFRVAC